jgi:restriction system protein
VEKEASSRRKKRQREAAIRSKEEKKDLAISKTEEAEKAIEGLEKTLEHTLSIDDTIEWSSLLDRKPFPKQEPIKPKLEKVHAEPSKSDQKYQPKLGFFDKLFSGSRNRKQVEASSLYLSDHKSWIERRANIESKNAKSESNHVKAVDQWRKEKIDYEQKQNANNQLIERKKEQYLQMESGVVSDYCEMVLGNSIK